MGVKNDLQAAVMIDLDSKKEVLEPRGRNLNS